MIRVNLLPEEYRPAEGASWSVLLTIIVAIVVVSGAGFVAFMMQVRSITAKTDLDDKRLAAIELKKAADKHDLLEKEIADARQREHTIKQIAMSKINWSKKLDELTDLILVDDMWIHELELIEGDGSTDKATNEENWGSLKIHGYFCGDVSGLVSDFYDQIKRHRSFFSIFVRTAPPRWQKKDINKEYSQDFIPEHQMNLYSTMELFLAGPEIPTLPQEEGAPEP